MRDSEVFYPRNRAEWRQWLEANHALQSSVWLVFYSKASGKPTISWSESVDEALCFGWIDSKKIRIDQEKSHQFFSKRKSKSTWSKINKEKVEVLQAAGMMAEGGLESIEVAKRNGSWSFLDEVEALLVPEDLENALAGIAGARDYFSSLSKSARKGMLQWVMMARRPETRQKRIEEIATLAGMKRKPEQF